MNANLGRLFGAPGRRCGPAFFQRLISRTSGDEIQHRTPLVRLYDSSEGQHMVQYGGRHVVTLLPGAGIGPELMEHVLAVFSCCNAPVDFEKVTISNAGDFEEAVLSIQRNGVALSGNIEPVVESVEVPSPNVFLRQILDLYANTLHCRSLPGVRCKQPGADVVVIRQNTEGEYSMLEHESVAGVVESLKVITRRNTERVAHWACRYALKLNRKRITVIHKANVMKKSDGLFKATVLEIGRQFYSSLKFDDVVVDKFTTKAVTDARQFDVVLMPNLYGTVAGNILCGVTGGPGLTAGKNFGDRYAIFEPGTRNTGTEIAGKDVANPVAMLMASAELLQYLGHNEHANLIKSAIRETIYDRHYHTFDLGGNARTSEVVAEIVRNLDKLMRTTQQRKRKLNRMKRND